MPCSLLDIEKNGTRDGMVCEHKFSF